MIYSKYYSNISSGLIDLNKVNFSAYVVDDTYEPKESDKKVNVIGKINTLRQILVGGDISTLTMGEITEKINSEIADIDKERAKGFVIYDISTGDLCFFENLI